MKKPGFFNLHRAKDGLLGGEKGWLAADFVTDLTDGLLVCEKGGLAAVLYADVADGLLGGKRVW